MRRLPFPSRLAGRGRTLRSPGGRVIGLGVLLVFAAFGASQAGRENGALGRGAWPTPRANRQLTGYQPLPGRMRTAPVVAAKVALPTAAPPLVPFASKPGGAADRVIALVD